MDIPITSTRVAPARHAFRALWAAKSFTNLGDGMLVAAAPLLAATLTQAPVAVGSVVAASRLPWLLCPLIAGAILDRVDRRRTIVGADLFRAVVLALAVAAIHTGRMSVTLLAVAMFLLGVAEVLSDMAAQTLVPRLVEPNRLEGANSRLQATEFLFNQVLGAAVGSFLFASMAALPFGATAAALVGSALAMARLPGRYEPERNARDAGRSMLGEIREGLRWLWGHQVMRTLALMAGVVNFAGAAVFGVLALYMQEVLGLPPAAYGPLLSVGALGGLGATLVAPMVARRLGPGTTAVAAQFGAGLCAALATLVSHYVPFVALLTLVMASGVLWNVVTVSYRQRVVPDGLLGRVNSVYRLLAWGALPLGAFSGGLIAEWLGLRAPFWLAAAVILVRLPWLTRVINNRTMAASPAA